MRIPKNNEIFRSFYLSAPVNDGLLLQHCEINSNYMRKRVGFITLFSGYVAPTLVSAMLWALLLTPQIWRTTFLSSPKTKNSKTHKNFFEKCRRTCLTQIKSFIILAALRQKVYQVCGAHLPRYRSVNSFEFFCKNSTICSSLNHRLVKLYISAKNNKSKSSAKSLILSAILQQQTKFFKQISFFIQR